MGMEQNTHIEVQDYDLTIELMKYWGLIKKWWWLVLASGLLCGTAALITSYFMASVYEATTQILVMRPPDEFSSGYDNLSEFQLVNTYEELINSFPILSTVEQKLGFEVDKDSIDIGTKGNTLIIEISVENEDPNSAAHIANTLVDTFIEYSESIERRRYESAEENLQNQIAQMELQISEIQNEITSISNEAAVKQAVDINQRLDDLEQILLQIPEQNSVIQEINQIRDLLSSEQEDGVLTQQNAVTSQGIMAIRVEQLQSTLSLYQEIYKELRSNYENIRLMKLNSAPNIIQVYSAQPPEKPIKPKPIMNAILGAFAGTFLGVFFVMLLEFFDTTIKNSEDVTATLNIPTLGTIGKISERGKGYKAGVYISKYPLSHIAEDYRTLRTNLEFTCVDKPVKSILITSPDSTSGKSTVATNLAISIAQTGKRAILLDADLRKPSIHSILGIPNRTGLSDYFRGKTFVPRDIKKGGDPPIFAITSGPLPPNPAELLGSNSMETIIDQLEEIFDLIIIDSPPGTMSDPYLLSRKVDGVLMVIKSGKTKKVPAREMLDQLRMANACILGAVLNSISKKRNNYYYSLISESTIPKVFRTRYKASN